MKEKDLVIDMYYSLKSILKEESEYSIMCFDAEIRNLLRSIRDTDEMLEDESFVVFDADDFRQGVCQTFAYELTKKYGYPVFVIEK